MSGDTHFKFGIVWSYLCLMTFVVITDYTNWVSWFMLLPAFSFIKVGIYLPDIDHNSGSYAHRYIPIIIIALVITALSITAAAWLLYLAGKSPIWKVPLPMLSLIGIYFFNKIPFVDKHRGFYHWWGLPLVAFIACLGIPSYEVQVICLGAVLGYTSHLLSDSITYNGTVGLTLRGFNIAKLKADSTSAWVVMYIFWALALAVLLISLYVNITDTTLSIIASQLWQSLRNLFSNLT